MFTVLYTFDDAKSRDTFMAAVNNLLTNAGGQELAPEEVVDNISNIQSVSHSFKAARKDPEILTVENSLTRIYVANKIIFEGKHTDAVRRFEQEVASHSAKVEMKKYNGEAWIVSRIRRR